MVRILGYGDSVFDDYFESKIVYPGGNALNVSVYAHELGADAGFLGVFADDRLGQYLKQITSYMHIDTSMCTCMKGTATQTCKLHLVGNDRVFVSGEPINNQVPFIHFQESFRPYMDSFDVVHMGCYIEAEDELPNFKLEKALLTYDLSNETDTLKREYYEKVAPYVDMILFSSPYDEEKTKEMMADIHALGCPNVLATRGTSGQLFYDGTFYKGTCEKVEAIDTCGAGDSFMCAFLYSLIDQGYHKGGTLQSEQIEAALRFANHFSAMNCMRKGAFGCAMNY